MITERDYEWLAAPSLPLWAALVLRGPGEWDIATLLEDLPGYTNGKLSVQATGLRRRGLIVAGNISPRKQFFTLAFEQELERSLQKEPIHRIVQHAALAGRRLRQPPLLALISMWKLHVQICKGSIPADVSDFSWLTDRAAGTLALVFRSPEELLVDQIRSISGDSHADHHLLQGHTSGLISRVVYEDRPSRRGSPSYKYFGEWQDVFGQSRPSLLFALMILVASQDAEPTHGAPAWARRDVASLAAYLTQKFAAGS